MQWTNVVCIFDVVLSGRFDLFPLDTSDSNVTKVGAHSYSEGEEACTKEGKTFVNLPLIKKYATLIGAVASWDSNLHEDDLLNKITPSAERIYLVVKVSHI